MRNSFQRVIATLNLFQGKQSLTIFLLAAMLAFSACDDSSSASSDETGVSSSSVESPDSSVTLSGASAESNGSSDENMEKDKSSSSVKGYEPAEVSSSSAKETKNSSDSKSSSSIKSGDSSSSKKDVSSSSVSSSSSEKQSSSSVGSSSSSEKQSSSSVASSSSEYVPFDHSKAFDGTLWRKGAYKTFVDERNNREYYYLQIDGKRCLKYSETNRCLSTKDTSISVMAENLNVGEMVRGFKDQKDDSKIERYCYDNDTANCDRYGGLYQWAEMMGFNDSCNTKSCAHLIQENHQGICPNGWRLLTYDDFYIIVNSNGNQDGVKGTRSTFGFGGSNDTGYSLVGAGYNWQHTFTRMNESTYWHYPQEGTLGDNTSFVGCQSRTETTLCSQSTYKTNGFSVRCVKVD